MKLITNKNIKMNYFLICVIKIGVGYRTYCFVAGLFRCGRLSSWGWRLRRLNGGWLAWDFLKNFLRDTWVAAFIFLFIDLLVTFQDILHLRRHLGTYRAVGIMFIKVGHGLKSTNLKPLAMTFVVRALTGTTSSGHDSDSSLMHSSSRDRRSSLLSSSLCERS